jgi:hypothetical protein
MPASLSTFARTTPVVRLTINVLTPYSASVRSLDDLITTDDPAWPAILGYVDAAPYPVELLPADPEQARSCLHKVQVTTRSWLGAVVLNTGGILIDHGWLRVLGSGNTERSLADIATANPAEPAETLVAVDVLGGQFIWGRSAAERPPTIHYFGPDTLDWQDLEVGYQGWLYSALTGSLDQFYETLRWPGWEAEVAACPLNQGINTYPPPFTVEGKDLATASRKPVSMTELTSYYAATAWQLG